LAAHFSASSREGTFTIVIPLMKSGFGPSVTVGGHDPRRTVFQSAG